MIWNLDEEVKQKEILEYFEGKYEEKRIVTQRTIRNWMKELKIECIQPTPKRNADRRYKKEDVLKLEQLKMDFLFKQKYKRQEKEYEKQTSNHLKQKAIDEFAKGIKLEEDYFRYLNLPSHERMSEDFELQIEIQADNIIKQDMLELCFKKLFPDILLDKEELKMNLLIVDSSIDSNDTERGIALDYLERKLYIKH
ncbi:hypothetical protein Plano_0079 [Planococcus sp. PAMC 21323]|uniref:MerR family transcriptional regulator n=1 Tax=Planococcus sp. PAMC 21323 TaxID=1526927 RepID=UPI00058640E9|nr:MerR family transcriptional regulator [Planococcus sp. PAMC 21323]AIY04044.1 hypothetical protein Plano_0079 [Planococcus sp. PAMC 21323]